MFSTENISKLPFSVRVGMPVISSVFSFVPFTKIPIDSPSNVEDKNDQFSVISLVDSTEVHFIPSNTENLAVFSDWRLLLIASENDFSLLKTVNSSVSEVKSGFTQAVTVSPSRLSVTVRF